MSYTISNKQLTKRNSTKSQRRIENIVDTYRDLVKSNPQAKNKVLDALRITTGKKATQVVRKAAASVTGRQVANVAGVFESNLVAAWNNNKPKIGCPFMNVVPSVKGRFFGTAVATIGTRGVGWISMNAVTTSDNSYCLAYTNAQYDTTTFNSTATGVTRTYATTLPYDNNDLQTGIKARAVATGFKAWYSGTALNRSGTWYSYRDPANEAVAEDNGTLTISDISSRRHCFIGAIGVKPVSVSQLPTDTDMLDYVQDATPYNSSNRYPILIAFTGVPGMTVTFQYCVDTEYIGTATEATSTGNKTSHKPPSHSLTSAQRSHDKIMDTIGFATALASTAVAAAKYADEAYDAGVGMVMDVGI